MNRKLRKSDLEFLEMLEDSMWDRYAEIERAKKTGVQSLVSLDQQVEAIPLKRSTVEHLDELAKKAYKQYCTLLQIVERVGYDSFTDESASNEEKLVRVHRILPHSEFVKLLKDQEVK